MGRVARAWRFDISLQFLHFFCGFKSIRVSSMYLSCYVAVIADAESEVKLDPGGLEWGWTVKKLGSTMLL